MRRERLLVYPRDSKTGHESGKLDGNRIRIVGDDIVVDIRDVPEPIHPFTPRPHLVQYILRLSRLLCLF